MLSEFVKEIALSGIVLNGILSFFLDLVIILNINIVIQKFSFQENRISRKLQMKHVWGAYVRV